jgi:glutamate dehydrogenase (NAD(P)+)
MSYADGRKFLTSVQSIYDQSVTYLDLPPGLAERIKACSSVIHFRFPIRVGKDVRIIHAYRAQHWSR